MTDSTRPPDPAAKPAREDPMAALFASLVLQFTQMGLMLMGKVPHPQSGETMRDLDHAQLIVDQLEMLEAKTQGNLGAEEAGLLKQSLMTLRLAFVEAVDAPATPKKPRPAEPAAGAPPAAGATVPASATEEESRKKFSKKY